MYMSPENFCDALRSAASIPEVEGEPAHATRKRRVDRINELIEVGVSNGYLRHPHSTEGTKISFVARVEAMDRSATVRRVGAVKDAQMAIETYMLKV